MYTIYGLIDPRDKKIFYVGRTARPPKKRFGEHLSEIGTVTLKQQRLESIKKHSNEKIDYVVLEGNIPTEKQAFCKEVFWIESLLKSGAELTNVSVDLGGIYFLREDTISDDVLDGNELNIHQDSTDCYVSASKSWISDTRQNDGMKILNDMGGLYFMLEDHVISGVTLLSHNLIPEKLLERRLTNIENKKLINHGMPILDEEIAELLKRYSKNCDFVKLENYFQRSRVSLKNMIQEYNVE